MDNRVKYLEDPNGLRDYQETDMYLGLHDFDGDGTPELIFGDGISAAVFTFLEGQLMKIADICLAGTALQPSVTAPEARLLSCSGT